MLTAPLQGYQDKVQENIGTYILHHLDGETSEPFFLNKEGRTIRKLIKAHDRRLNNPLYIYVVIYFASGFLSSL